ncbi:multiheme c-type cytochrome [Endozoicomonas atrinae]|uniref:multiheme c-type cytochrome n=1 Tax=Endozoicomonas atrinae TaxID=1333660 RepID=UPI0008242FDA|nr:multiheme c-type cytochrome [Endozoicomonas atrinae]
MSLPNVVKKGGISLLLWVISQVAYATSGNYAGSQVCAACHVEAYTGWKQSQHHSALQQARRDNVLGDFNNTTFRYGDVTSRFFFTNDQPIVETDGPEGKKGQYNVAFTIGDYPLQQYLIEYPGGRLQALGIAWDSRPESEGGQRWFHLYPDDDIDYRSPLHWTQPSQNGNRMCIECHTTGYQKGYQAESDWYKSQWQEVGVGCESCHGPASAHVEWAQNPDKAKGNGLSVDISDANIWHWLPGASIAQSVDKKAQKQIEICAQCHSRREAITSGFQVDKPLNESYQPELLRSGLYHSDGQINDEVFVYGSFAQSKMFQAGVTCTNCHDPHTNQLKAPPQQVCAQCHNPQVFDTPKHTFHKAGSAGAECVSCHMPEKTYMVVDPRRDHAFKTPRPDLSKTLGTPNACIQCHDDKSNRWAVSALDQWLGTTWRNKPEFASTFHLARTSNREAGKSLLEIAANDGYAPMIRATAYSEIANYLSRSALPVIQQGLSDSNPIVRSAAVSALTQAPAQLQHQLLLPLMKDSSKAVRLEVARIVAGIPEQWFSAEQKGRRQQLIEEFVAVQQLHADSAAGRINLGQFYLKLGRATEAVKELENAIAVEPLFDQAYIQLASTYHQVNRHQEEQAILQKGLKTIPMSASLNHAMGLYLVRQKQREASIAYLEKAADLMPDNARFIYIYGVALHSTGKVSKAIDILKQGLDRFPENIDIGNALRAYESAP